MVRSAPCPFCEALGFSSRHCHAVGQAELSEPWAPAAVEDRVERLGVKFAFPAVLGLPGGQPSSPQSPPPGLDPHCASCCRDCGAFESNGRKDLNAPLGKGSPLGLGIGDQTLHRLPLREELVGIKGLPSLESFFSVSIPTPQCELQDSRNPHGRSGLVGC